MGPEEFVAALIALREQVVEIEVAQLGSPSGRNPWPVALGRSRWWATLSDDDRLVATSLIRVGADSALLSLLSLLDGTSGFLEVPGDSLRLSYVAPDGSSYWLNDPDVLELHSEFRGDGPPS